MGAHLFSISKLVSERMRENVGEKMKKLDSVIRNGAEDLAEIVTEQRFTFTFVLSLMSALVYHQIPPEGFCVSYINGNLGDVAGVCR